MTLSCQEINSLAHQRARGWFAVPCSLERSLTLGLYQGTTYPTGCRNFLSRTSAARARQTLGKRALQRLALDDMPIGILEVGKV